MSCTNRIKLNQTTWFGLVEPITKIIFITIKDFLLDSLMNKIEHWRVILEESHLIKNVNTQQNKIVANLNTKRM